MASKSSDDKKVMDISKPDAAGAEASTSTDATKSKAPSATRKIIQPLSPDIKPEDSGATSIDVVSGSSGEDESAQLNSTDTSEAVAPGVDPETPDSEESKQQLNDGDSEITPITVNVKPSTKDVTPTEEPTGDSGGQEDKPDEVAEQSTDSTPEPEPKAEPEPTEEPKIEEQTPPASSEPAENSDAAGVDELAKAAEAKREANKKAEEEKIRFAELEELVASKKYFVKTSHNHDFGGSGGSSKKFMLVLILLLIGLIGAYLLIDSKVINNSIKLPYEFFKEELVTENTQNNIDTSKDETLAGVEESKETDNQSSTDITARDTDRKNELKNIQQKLETFYSDNGYYPAELADLTPLLTDDELQDQNSVAYLYTPTPDGCDNDSVECAKYSLSAALENSLDNDADTNGNYVIKSIN